MRVALALAALLSTVEPLALKRRGGLAKPKKKKAKKAPASPSPPPPPQAPLSPEAHMAAVARAVEAAAPGIRSSLADDDFYAQEAFLDARSVAAMAHEARQLDCTLVPSQSTRYEAGQTIAYDKAGVRSTQILGGDAYETAPRLTEYVVSLTAALAVVAGRLRPLSKVRQTNKLAVCDAVGAAYPKHIDNGGGDDPRLLTAILYLDGACEGGRFRAFAAAEDTITAEVAPAPGTFVCFWADRLVHDVSAITRLDMNRWALTVWLCTDDPIVEATPEAVVEAHWPRLKDT